MHAAHTHHGLNISFASLLIIKIKPEEISHAPLHRQKNRERPGRWGVVCLTQSLTAQHARVRANTGDSPRNPPCTHTLVRKKRQCVPPTPHDGRTLHPDKVTDKHDKLTLTRALDGDRE